MNKVTVHSFVMGDVEDPAIYAAQPIWEWQQTEAGQWVMAHSVPAPEWTVGLDPYNYGYRVCITANLSKKDTTFFLLKYNREFAK